MTSSLLLKVFLNKAAGATVLLKLESKMSLFRNPCSLNLPMQADSSSKSNLPKKKRRGQGERQVCVALHGIFRKKGTETCFGKGESLHVKEAKQKAVEQSSAVTSLKVGAAKVDGGENW